MQKRDTVIVVSRWSKQSQFFSIITLSYDVCHRKITSSYSRGNAYGKDDVMLRLVSNHDKRFFLLR